MTDDYDRRKDDRLEAGLCQWCGHTFHAERPCAVFLSGPAYRRQCKCGATTAIVADPVKTCVQCGREFQGTNRERCPACCTTYYVHGLTTAPKAAPKAVGDVCAFESCGAPRRRGSHGSRFCLRHVKAENRGKDAAPGSIEKFRSAPPPARG